MGQGTELRENIKSVMLQTPEGVSQKDQRKQSWEEGDSRDREQHSEICCRKGDMFTQFQHPLY